MTKYEEAKELGYTDEQIRTHLKEKYDESIEAGYEESEIEEASGVPSGFFSSVKAEDLTTQTEETTDSVPIVTTDENKQHMDNSIARLEEMKLKHPDLVSIYDAGIIRAKEDYQAREDKKIKDELTRTQNKKTLEEMRAAPDATDRTVDTAEGMGRGAGRMFLGLGKVGQDALGALTDEEYSQFDTWIAKNEKAIKDKGLEGSALVGEVLSNIIPVARLKALGWIITTEGIVAASSELGKGSTYKEAGERGATAAALTGATGAIVNKFFPDIPIDKVDTDFKKSIMKLDADDQKRINEVLNYTDTKDIKLLDAEARTAIVNDVFAGKKSASEIAKGVKLNLARQKKVAKGRVDQAYAKADKEARLLTVDESIKFKHQPKTKDEAKTVKDIKQYLKPKWNKTAEDLERTISSLKNKQNSATGVDRKIYGDAIKAAQSKQDDIGGAGIYAGARKLSKDFNTEYTGIIKKGEEATAGATAARVIDKDFSEDIGAMLIGRDIDPNRIGVAVKSMTTKQKDAVIHDLLTKKITDEAIDSADGAKQILTNYKTMDKKGLQKLLGKSKALQLDTKMKALNEVELAIKSAKGQDLSIADDILALGTAGATAKLSPYLAARTTIYATKGILSKIGKSKHAELVQRVKTVKNNRLRQSLTRALGSIATAETPEETRESNKKRFQEARNK